ncbi:MAG: hypothetical protein IJ240_08855 [Clostridia bacterium]|nr:hypothetical protein [Clostridia bacterium]
MEAIVIWIFVALIARMVSQGKKKAAHPTGKAVHPASKAGAATAKASPKPQEKPVPQRVTPLHELAEKSHELSASWSEEGGGPTHRGKDGTLHPTERRPLSPGQAEALHEGDDPCHAYMLDDSVLPVCPDDEESAAPTEAGFSLAFTADSVVNGVIMSEILNRKKRRSSLRP